MADANRNSKILVQCLHPTIMNRLSWLERRLDVSQKELSSYVAEKRDGFPRFYFVSDDDLLFVYGNADPCAVQQRVIQVRPRQPFEFHGTARVPVFLDIRQRNESEPRDPAAASRDHVDDHVRRRNVDVQKPRGRQTRGRQMAAEGGRSNANVQPVLDQKSYTGLGDQRSGRRARMDGRVPGVGLPDRRPCVVDGRSGTRFRRNGRGECGRRPFARTFAGRTRRFRFADSK